MYITHLITVNYMVKKVFARKNVNFSFALMLKCSSLKEGEGMKDKKFRSGCDDSIG